MKFWIIKSEVIKSKVIKLKHLNKTKIALIFLAVLILIGYLIPENLMIPVKGATQADWNKQSFWFEPWGKSGVHKGIDIFGYKGQPIVSASKGIVAYTGEFSLGGKVIIVLGPKWRFHYYAHMDTIETESFSFVSSGDRIGTNGNSGNAKGKPPHLHYSMVTLFPYFWRLDRSTQGWKKIFFLDPGEKLVN